MDKKFAIQLYAEQLHFLILKRGWKVLKVWAHYPFEQSKLKKEYDIMSQVSRQSRFSIKKNEMFLEEIEKSEFAQMNDERYYFSDRIVSLPFSHTCLHELFNLKEIKSNEIESLLQKEKHKLIRMEKFSLEKKHTNFTL